jgi:hypothetical protein
MRNSNRVSRHGSSRYQSSLARLASRVTCAATAPLRACPDFIIIGARKAGTTALYRYLAEHPGIRFATRKEVHFFDTNFAKGINWYRAHFPLRAHQEGVRAVRGRPFLVGEASPYYLFHPCAAARTQSVLSSARLIVVLRNPVDRAYSQFTQEFCSGRETLGFEEAIASEADRLAGAEETLLRGGQHFSHRFHSYLARGLYAEQLVRWLEAFPREQFLFVDSHQLARDTARAMTQVYGFLGLPPRAPGEYRKHNSFAYEPMQPATRRRLLDYFAPHNERLFGMLGVRYAWES